jgi:hypothetical protein
VSEATDGFVGIVHGKSNAVALEVENLMLDYFTVFSFKFYGEFSFSFGYEIGCAILITEGMATDADGGCPVGNQAWYIGANNGLTKNGAIENVTDGAVGTFPHLLEAEFFYPCFIGCDGRALDANPILPDGIGGIYGHLIVGGIAVFHAEVIIFYVEVQVGKDEFVFDEFPDDAGHFVAIQFHYGICYLDFVHFKYRSSGCFTLRHFLQQNPAGRKGRKSVADFQGLYLFDFVCL